MTFQQVASGKQPEWIFAFVTAQIITLGIAGAAFLYSVKSFSGSAVATSHTSPDLAVISHANKNIRQPSEASAQLLAAADPEVVLLVQTSPAVSQASLTISRSVPTRWPAIPTVFPSEGPTAERTHLAAFPKVFPTELPIAVPTDVPDLPMAYPTALPTAVPTDVPAFPKAFSTELPTAASTQIPATSGADNVVNTLPVQPQAVLQIPGQLLIPIDNYYTVESGDSFASVSQLFQTSPRSIREANQLSHTAMLFPGQVLAIPAGAGTPRTARRGDSLIGVAAKNNTNILSILAVNGLHIPTLFDGQDFTLPPACLQQQPDTGEGRFIWPTDYHFLAGRDYVSGHPGIDLAAPLNMPIRAAQSGMVAFGGWTNWGFGNSIVLDHGNGWQSLYAHLDVIDVACGQPVAQGQVIGMAGSTGKSSGPHLHFEIVHIAEHRNPLHYLP